MKLFHSRYKLYGKLGYYSCLLVGLYQLRKSLGLVPKFFDQLKYEFKASSSTVAELTERGCCSLTLPYYGYRKVCEHEICWHKDYITGTTIPADTKWFKIKPEEINALDIKNVWELSRFYWYPEYAFQSRSCKSKSVKILNGLDRVLIDWGKENPPFLGPNWICAQEASIRLINFILGREISLNKEHSPYERSFVLCHCKRIDSTLCYSKGQKSNHALSEACGLFLGGLYLFSQSYEPRLCQRYIKRGRKLLNWCFKNLVLEDGAFSQYSVNYQKECIDILSVCFILCHKWGFEIPYDWMKKFEKMQNFLVHFMDVTTGRFSNIGANDGTDILSFLSHNYQCCRLSIILSSNVLDLYHSNVKNDDLVYQALCKAMKRNKESSQIVDTKCIHFDKSGYVRLQSDSSWAIFRYPKFKFRPSQCDIMHFDLWVKGINVLLDSGTYSYNTTDEFQNYFKSVTAHNTVQIDNLEQMRSVSRFLYLDWPKAKNIDCQRDDSGNIIIFSCSYTHYSGAIHHRKIELEDDVWVITDTLSGLNNKADLFWHLPLLDGEFCHHRYENNFIILSVACDQPGMSVNTSECWISKHYQHKERALLITASCSNINTCTFITTIEIK